MFYRRVERFFEQFEDALDRLGAAADKAGSRLLTTRILRSQVRALIATVDSGSFGQAAQSLGLAQASLQRAARDLQSNLPRPIYYRTAAGMSLTPEGIEFASRMKLALQEIDWGIRELEEVRGGLAGPIVVGAMPLSGSALVASMLEDFTRSYPRAEITVQNENAALMLKSLRAGNVDFVVGLVLAEAVGDLTTEALVHTPYSIVGRIGHPLLVKERVTADDLMSYDWVIGLEGSSRRACFDRLFGGRRGASTPIASSVVSIIHHLLANSNRLTLTTSFELQHQSAGLTAIPYTAITPVPAIGITTRTNWLPTRLHTAFIDMTREHTAASLTVGRG